MRRIGIFAGVFNPVHTGHVATALQAIEKARLDEVVFLPERRPRHKTGVEHFGHRVAMLNRAVRPHAKLSVLELVDTSFSVKRILNQLKRLYPDSQLVFLWGSDTAKFISDWPDADTLFAETEFVTTRRAGMSWTELWRIIDNWPVKPQKLYLFDSFAGEISSSGVREALRRRHQQPGLLASVARYADQNWLYVTFS